MMEIVAWVSIVVAVGSAVVIAIDEVRRPQTMGVMNLVWPITALYLSGIAVWWYWRVGRRMAVGSGMEMGGHGQGSMGGSEGSPTFGESALAASHCGAGCVLGDLVTEYLVFAMGLTVAGSMLLASFVWDFVAAWSLGILFQYFTIKPMRNLTVREALVAAVKADTLSIVAFQVGMYGWMLIMHFVLFPASHMEANRASYWMMMQVAMVCGFMTSLPMNWWLVKIGWKEKMG
jgi:hypothetical protein